MRALRATGVSRLVRMNFAVFSGENRPVTVIPNGLLFATQNYVDGHTIGRTESGRNVARPIIIKPVTIDVLLCTQV